MRQRCLACGVPPDRCALIENAIDTAEFSRQVPVGEAKLRVGIPPERFVIGAVGRLSAEKGFDVLIRSTHQLLQDGLDAELLIIGEGDEKTALQTLIADLGCAERIRLLGYRSDTRDLYQAMDVFALSSIREGLPNVLLEAMAFEVPVVATRIAGIPRLIRDGENGLLVEPGDGTGLSRAVFGMHNDADLRSRLARAGRRTIEAGYSFQARMEKIRDIYDRLLGRR